MGKQAPAVRSGGSDAEAGPSASESTVTAPYRGNAVVSDTLDPLNNKPGAEFTVIVRQDWCAPVPQPPGTMSQTPPFQHSDPPNRNEYGSNGSNQLEGGDGIGIGRGGYSGTEEGGAGGGPGDVDLAALSEPNGTMRRLLKEQAVAAAVAFNVAYEEENSTPLYNRCRIAPLRLGSGLAASALPLSIPAAPPTLTMAPCAASASLTHGSLPSALGPSAAASHAPLPHGVGSRADCAGEAQGPPLKRRRLDGDVAGGGCAAGDSFSLGSDLAFVLNRCWNCGSYGHDLRSCRRPRNQAVIDTRQREHLQSRRAALAEQRRARQAPQQQRRGPRHKASHRRYFSMDAHREEEDGPAAEWTTLGAAACVFDPSQALTRAPAGVRPGVLSAALAAALGLKCPLDPPPWLVSMALYGIPPAYRSGPYKPPDAEAAAELPAAEVAEPLAEKDATAPLPAVIPPPAVSPPLTMVVVAAGGADGVGGSDGVAQALMGPAAAPGRCDDQSEETAVCGTVATAVAAAAMVPPSAAAPDEEADAHLLLPLLPDAPCHVPYTGLNTPVAVAACGDRWRRALGGARQAVGFVEAVRAAMQMREQKRPHQQHGQESQSAEQQAPQWSNGQQQQQQQHTMAMMMALQQQPQQQLCWQQQMLWRQQQLQQQQQLRYQFMMGQQQQQGRAAQGIPFFFGGPTFQGQGQGGSFPGFR